MTDDNAGQPAGKSRSLLSRTVRPLGGLMLIVGVWYGAGAAGKLLQPWRYAGAETCIETDYNLGAYRNTCDHAITMGWCADGPPADGSACITEPLAPQAVSTSWIGTLPEGMGRPGWRHACEAPYLPAWIKDPNKAARKINGCRRVPEAEQAAG